MQVTPIALDQGEAEQDGACRTCRGYLPDENSSQPDKSPLSSGQANVRHIDYRNEFISLSSCPA